MTSDNVVKSLSDINLAKGEYLRALGIQPYTWVYRQSRRQPPGAEAEVLVSEIASSATPPEAEVSPPPEPAEAPALTPEPDNAPKELSPPATPVTTANTSASAYEAFADFTLPTWADPATEQFNSNFPRFALCFSQFEDKLLVVYDASRHKHVVDASDQQLLSKIAFALLQEQLSNKVNAFSWPPLPATAPVDLGLKVARSAAQAYWQQRLRKNKAQCILILGRVASCYLLPPEQLQQGFERLRGQLLKTNNTPTLVSEEISLLQEQPASKRRAWEEMQLLLGD